MSGPAERDVSTEAGPTDAPAGTPAPHHADPSTLDTSAEQAPTADGGVLLPPPPERPHRQTTKQRFRAWWGSAAPQTPRQRCLGLTGSRCWRRSAVAG